MTGKINGNKKAKSQDSAKKNYSKLSFNYK